MTKNSLFLLFILTASSAFGQEEEYISFLRGLTVESTVVDSNEVGYSNFWKSFLNIPRDVVLSNSKGLKSFEKNLGGHYKRPNTKPFFDRKLYLNGIEIEERNSKEANGVIGMAKCVSGKPKIFYDLKIESKIPSEAIVFFREHEYAHFKLGHSGCGLENSEIDGHKKELAADLEAAKTILTFAQGVRIVDFIVATFLTMNESQDRYHPSSKDRVINLYMNLNDQVSNQK